MAFSTWLLWLYVADFITKLFLKIPLDYCFLHLFGYSLKRLSKICIVKAPVNKIVQSVLTGSVHFLDHCLYQPLREKCPNAEFFLVRIFLYSDGVNTTDYSVRKQEITDQEKLRIWTIYSQCYDL